MSDYSVRWPSFSGGASRVLGLFGTLKQCSSTRPGFLSTHTHLLCPAADGIRDRTKLGWSGEHPVIKHRLHLSRVHGDEELEDSRYAACAGLRPRFLNPVHLTEAPHVPHCRQKRSSLELLRRTADYFGSFRGEGHGSYILDRRHAPLVPAAVVRRSLRRVSSSRLLLHLIRFQLAKRLGYTVESKSLDHRTERRAQFFIHLELFNPPARDPVACRTRLRTSETRPHCPDSPARSSWTILSCRVRFRWTAGEKRRSEPRSRRFRASYAEGRFSARGAAFGGTGKGVEWRKKARRHTAAAASHSCCHEWRPPARRGGPDRARPGRLPHLPGRLQPDHPDRHAHRRPGGHRAASTPSPSSGTGSTPAPAPAPAACTATST